jgi:hypothetical protein
MFVVGFSQSGQVLCNGPGETSPPVPAPIHLPYGQLFDDYLSSFPGVANASMPFENEIAGVGTLKGTVNLVGFALCQPPDPLALPSLVPPAYPCLPEVNVTFVANNPTQATLTIEVAHVFVRATGNWALVQPVLPDRSGLMSGVALFSGVRFRFDIALVPVVDSDGLKTFAPVGSTQITTEGSNIDIDFGDDLVNVFAGVFGDFVLPWAYGQVGDLARSAVNMVLATIPPFVL